MTAMPVPDSLVVELAAGRIPYEQLRAFPHDEAAGIVAVTGPDGHRASASTPSAERERVRPRVCSDEARRAGLPSIQVDEADCGLGLSGYDTFRMISKVMQRSTAAGFALGVHDGAGLPWSASEADAHCPPAMRAGGWQYQAVVTPRILNVIFVRLAGRTVLLARQAQTGRRRTPAELDQLCLMALWITSRQRSARG